MDGGWHGTSQQVSWALAPPARMNAWSICFSETPLMAPPQHPLWCQRPRVLHVTDGLSG